MFFCSIDPITGRINRITTESIDVEDIELTTAEMEEIRTSKKMHMDFSIIGGILTRNPPLTGAELLQAKRKAAVLTPMQFMLNVDAAGLTAGIEAYLVDPATPNSFKIMWNRASSFERLYPDLVAAATQLGVTDAQLDAVFGIV